MWGLPFTLKLIFIFLKQILNLCANLVKLIHYIFIYPLTYHTASVTFSHILLGRNQFGIRKRSGMRVRSCIFLVLVVIRVQGGK